MARLAAKLVVLSRKSETFVLALPFGLSFIIIAQTDVFVLVIGSVWTCDANNQRSIQLGNGKSISVCQGDVQNGAAQLLIGEALRYAGDECDG